MVHQSDPELAMMNHRGPADVSCSVRTTVGGRWTSQSRDATMTAGAPPGTP